MYITSHDLLQIQTALYMMPPYVITLTQAYNVVFSDRMISFRHVTDYNQQFLLFLGLVAFLAQLQLLHLLRYNATIAMLGTMLRKSVGDMLSYAVLGGIVFMGFSSVAALTFWIMEDYATYGKVTVLYKI